MSVTTELIHAERAVCAELVRHRSISDGEFERFAATEPDIDREIWNALHDEIAAAIEAKK